MVGWVDEWKECVRYTQLLLIMREERERERERRGKLKTN